MACQIMYDYNVENDFYRDTILPKNNSNIDERNNTHTKEGIDSEDQHHRKKRKLDDEKLVPVQQHEYTEITNKIFDVSLYTVNFWITMYSRRRRNQSWEVCNSCPPVIGKLRKIVVTIQFHKSELKLPLKLRVLLSEPEPAPVCCLKLSATEKTNEYVTNCLEFPIVSANCSCEFYVHVQKNSNKNSSKKRKLSDSVTQSITFLLQPGIVIHQILTNATNSHHYESTEVALTRNGTNNHPIEKAMKIFL